ncbi:MAG: hypothetical protein HOW73_38325 [Polyangiaceae bacterium]|nr:hypothetical protein [Polyangiaceae bacterium]
MPRRAPSSFFVFLFVVALPVFHTRPAAADPLRGTLEIRRAAGAEDCPDTAAMVQRVEELAGAKILSAGKAAEVTLVVDIARSNGGYKATIKLSGARDGEREIDDAGPKCTALSEGLAVTILILLDAAPSTSPEPGPTPPPDVGPTPPDINPTPPTDTTPPPAPRRRRRAAYWLLPAVEPYRPEPRVNEPPPPFAIAAAALYDFGTLDDATGGLSLAFDAYFRWVSIEAAVTMLPHDEKPSTSRPLLYDYYAGSIRGCFQPLSRALGFALCSGWAAGVRRANLEGVEDVSATGAHVAATFELELTGKLSGPFGVFTTVRAGVPLLQGDLSIDFPSGGHASSPESAATFQLAVGGRFWIQP